MTYLDTIGDLSNGAKGAEGREGERGELERDHCAMLARVLGVLDEVVQ